MSTPDDLPWLTESRPFMASSRPARRKLAIELLDAGLDLLTSAGPTLGTEEVNLGAAIAVVNDRRGPGEKKVSPGSVYDRLWSHPDEFKVDVMAKALYEWFAPEESPEMDLTVAEVERALDEVELDSSEGRVAAVRELARRGGGANARAIDKFDEWMIRSSLLASFVSRKDLPPEQRAQLMAAAEQGYQSSTETYSGLYSALTEILGLRFKSSVFGTSSAAQEKGLETVTRLISALAEGAALRRRIESRDLDDLELPTGPDGMRESWDLFGLGLWAVVTALTEPIDVES